MSNAATTRRRNKSRINSLSLRLIAQRNELETCTTAAQIRCVEESMADTMRQLGEAMG